MTEIKIPQIAYWRYFEVIIKSFNEQKPLRQKMQVNEEKFIEELFNNVILGLTMLDVNYAVRIILDAKTKSYIL